MIELSLIFQEDRPHHLIHLVSVFWAQTFFIRSASDLSVLFRRGARFFNQQSTFQFPPKKFTPQYHFFHEDILQQGVEPPPSDAINC